MENVFETLRDEIWAEIRQAKTEILEATQRECEKQGQVDILLGRHLSLQRVAKIFEVSPKTLHLAKSEIKHVKRFGKIYFDIESLAAYMEAGAPEEKSRLVLKRGRR